MTHKIAKFQMEHLQSIDLRDIDKEINYRNIDDIKYADKIGITYLVDDEVIACGGVIPIKRGVGESWLLCSKNYKKHWINIGRYMLDVIKGAYDVFDLHRIQGLVNVNDEDSRRFHDRYYVLEGLLKEYGANKEDFFIYRRLRNGR